MPPSLQRFLPLILILGLAGTALFLHNRHRQPHPPTPFVPPPPSTETTTLSVLGEAPDWPSLDVFQHTITRADFERLLTTVFTSGQAWREIMEIDDSEARIRTSGDPNAAVFALRFAPPASATPTPRHWKTADELPPAPPEKPLEGLHIAIDPGHIGGPWAEIEERWLLVGNSSPIREGDMTLLVAKLLKPRLEALGARVSLVRENNEPITPLRPDSLITLAEDTASPPDSPAALRKSAERLFYRTAEIRARAHKVNHSIQPDLVLCLHFNADPWGDPQQPTLVNRTHLHLLLNGAYTDDELAFADQRFAMLRKLLSRTHEEEALVASTVADTFAERTGLPPFVYPADSPNALPVNGHPYLWARNLLANRLYDCPVIFMEPYVMNSTIDHPRLAAGDYDGLRVIAGKSVPSIFREYADALAAGLARHYAEKRR